MTATETSPVDAIATRVRSGRRFLITSHRSPDGDAIGSSLALQGILRKLGKEATIVVRDDFGPQLRRVPGAEGILVADALPADYPDGWDALFTMECPDHQRTGFPVLPGPVINIDHHAGNAMYGEINYLDVDAPSVGEMVYRLNGLLGVEIDADIATAMYVSLATDTGFFRYSNTTLRAFQAAEAFVSAGADPAAVSRWINESSSAAAIRLLGLCLTSMQFHENGRIATIELRRAVLDETGARPDDSEGIVNYGRVIDTVLVSVLLTETATGCRVSMRSKESVDVQAVASLFGGGGHKAAAGCFVPLPMEQAKEKIVNILREVLPA